MRRRRRLAVVLLLGCLGCGPSGPGHEGPRLNDTLGEPGLSILRGATKVDVFRVSPVESRAPEVEAIGGFPITSVGKPRGPDFAAKLASVLLGDSVRANMKKCGLEPGVAFRVWRGNEAVDVLICFKCDVLLARLMGDRDRESWYGMEDFDPVRADLVGLAKDAFPDDEEIQGLSAERRH